MAAVYGFPGSEDNLACFHRDESFVCKNLFADLFYNLVKAPRARKSRRCADLVLAPFDRD